MELFLVIYVDDFKMSGKGCNIQAGWKVLRDRLNIEDPEPVNLYLGCKHELATVPGPGGLSITVLK